MYYETNNNFGDYVYKPWPLKELGRIAKENMEEKRRPLPSYECTAEAPWNEETMEGQSFHPNAVVIKEADDIAFSSGNKTEYQCPHCGEKFKVTEPDY